MRTFIFNPGLLLLASVGLLYSCKKHSSPTPSDIYYTTSIEGYTVTFTNQTTGASSYKWDFGDGTSSTEASPSHEYPGKGKYVPTLYATNAAGVTDQGSTVIHISKASAVSMTDNSLSDWDSVAHNMVVSGPGGGNFIKAKYDYNSNYLYCYYEMNATVAQGNVFDFYFDVDNNTATGYNSWMFNGAGNDVVLEGSLFAGGWLSVFYFAGGSNQGSWTWNTMNISNYYQVGDVVQDGSTLKFEVAFDRAKLQGFLGTGMKIGVSCTKSDWSAVTGNVPDQTSASFSLDMSE
ncbi:MAG TPA: PKD domain-containing protein [Puia sp.]|jgi:PKD repeat protein